MIQDELFRPETGLVICVSGPSGVGKGTVISEVMRREPLMQHSISITTRKARRGEVDGRDYVFTTPQDFEEMIAKREILEYDCYCDNYYGTPRRPLENWVRNGRDVLMDITVPGSLSVMENYPDAITIFLMPPSFAELERRLRKRGTESPEVVNRRLQKAKEEIGMAKLFQYVLVNDTLSGAARDILSIARAEHCRYRHMAGIENIILTR